MKAVNAVPAIVLPPIAVRLRTLSAATPAGAFASTIAGSVFDPAALARRCERARRRTDPRGRGVRGQRCCER